jgi:hypothetical protein
MLHNIYVLDVTYNFKRDTVILNKTISVPATMAIWLVFFLSKTIFCADVHLPDSTT